MRSLLAALPTSLADRAHAWKHRVYWMTRGGRSHETYYDNYRTRDRIVQVAVDWLRQHPDAPARVLEFGCSGGNNLRLLRELHGAPLDYLGLDLLPEAIAFGRRQFPDARFEVADDREFVRRAPSYGRWPVFLASGVLSYIPEERARSVLQAAARLSDLLVVCDELSHFDASTGGNDGVFLHPYRILCREVGLRIHLPPSPLGSHRYGLFTATPHG